ncbi:DEAD/DEAH box helicase family protein [Roseiflexus castenholzii]|uniref:DEAD/DEAH box helicase family protein n=1 Tax=Roseiflexus castenholzii TaxID=120962 RepID=UPI003C7AD93F
MSRDEDQTRRELINPKLRDRGWTEDLIRVERTVGGAKIIGGKSHKRKGRTDYLLCLPVGPGKSPLAVAIIEAKKEAEFPALGIQQAMDYRRRFHVPFVFSTNGHLFAKWAEDSGQTIDNLPLEQFPTPDQLRQRYEAIKGYALSDDQAQALWVPYKGGEAARWYFQDAAIRAALEKIAQGGKRILLSLATGTGKTIIVVQLLHKLAQAGQLRRALFVCDRDELRTQGWAKMHAVFGDNAKIVTTSDPQKNARILIASYQTLNITDADDEPRFWRENYPPGFFSHIIIDECHRSAWGKWSIILTDNPDAVHIGLTATPRIITGGRKNDPARQADEAITAHNIEYFGEPVYEYPMWMGQEDGYLAASEVVRRVVDLDQQAITREDIEQRTATDPFTGQQVAPDEIEERYTANQYEEKLMLPDRVRAMCADLFQHLLDTGGPHQKTIIFCVRDSHATMVAQEMNNLYQAWRRYNAQWPVEYYAFQCTGNPNLRPPAADLIPEFRGSKASHFVATTVDLLSTGVDIPNLENVVFFQYLQSPIEFYQRVGRGTRTGEPRGSKLMFRIYDYTNATRLFGQPFVSRTRPTGAGSTEEQPAAEKQIVERPDVPYTARPLPGLIRVEGFEVHVYGSGRAIVVEEGGRETLMPVEEYEQRLAARLTAEAPTLDDLRERWVWPERRRELLERLPGDGAAVRLIRYLRKQEECDLYDVLAELGYGVVARSRAERAAAFSYKQRNWLKGLPGKAASVLVAVAGQFARGGIDELETPHLFDVQEVRKAGGFNALLGLPLPPEQLIQETKARLLAA